MAEIDAASNCSKLLRFVLLFTTHHDMDMTSSDQWPIFNSSLYDPPTLVAASAQRGPDMGFQICQGVETANAPHNTGDILLPARAVLSYFESKNVSFKDFDPAKAVVTVLNAPAHGSLSAWNLNANGPFAKYSPAAGYLGEDQVVYAIEWGGKRLQVTHILQVVPNIGEDDTFCAGKVYYIKRITAIDDVAGNFAAWMRATELSTSMSAA